jgi:hypothetical protein
MSAGGSMSLFMRRLDRELLATTATSIIVSMTLRSNAAVTFTLWTKRTVSIYITT